MNSLFVAKFKTTKFGHSITERHDCVSHAKILGAGRTQLLISRDFGPVHLKTIFLKVDLTV